MKTLVFYARGMYARYRGDFVGKMTAALAYYLIFSFCPLLLFVSTLIGFLNLEQAPAESFSSLLPGEVIGLVNGYIGYVSDTKNSSLMLLGLVLTVGSVMRAVDCLLTAVIRAYRAKPPKSFLLYQLKLLIFTAVLMAGVVLTLSLLTAGRMLLTYLGRWIYITESFINVWNTLRFLLVFAVLFALLCLLYCLAPSKPCALREVMPGTFAALISWFVLSVGFSFYVENFGSYSVLYGSIGAVIVLLLWLNLSSLVLIMGAELNGLAWERKNKES